MPKQQVTIMISPNILKIVDKLSKNRITSRSSTIEYYLRKGLRVEGKLGDASVAE